MRRKFLLCINDGGYPEALEPQKFYRVVADREATVEGMTRVVDESGEDYLYPVSCFVDVALPQAVEKSLSKAA